MATATPPPGLMGRIVALLARLRQRGGKRWADLLVTAAVATVAAFVALALNTTTPMRFVENLTYDLRQAMGAPAAQSQFVIIKVDDEALKTARLALAVAVRQVLRNGLSLLGVSQPASM